MKTNLKLAVCMLLATFTFIAGTAQDSSTKTGKIEVITSVFAGTGYTVGDTSEKCGSVIGNYLRNNINYPENAINCCLQGTELLRFTVLQNGDLENIKVLNSVCPKIDDEVIRVLKTTNGMWTPGNNNGIPFEMEKEILIVFHLCSFHFGTDNEYFMKKATNWYKRGNIALFNQKNPEKALKCYNNAIRYKPLEDALLFARGMVKYELDDIEGAKSDWKRMKTLAEKGENENNLGLLVENFKNFSGYNEFLE